jgi:hypothetical protein
VLNVGSDVLGVVPGCLSGTAAPGSSGLTELATLAGYYGADIITYA